MCSAWQVWFFRPILCLCQGPSMQPAAAAALGAGFALLGPASRWWRAAVPVWGTAEPTAPWSQQHPGSSAKAPAPQGLGVPSTGSGCCRGSATFGSSQWSRGWPGARRGPRAVGAPRSGWAVMIEVIVRDAGGRIHELIPANEGHVQRGRARGTSPRHSSPTPGDSCVPSRPPQPDPPSAAGGLRCARGVRGTVVRGPGVRCPPGE